MKMHRVAKVAAAPLLASLFLITELVSGAVTASIRDRDVDVVWSTSDGQRQEIYYAGKQEGVWTEPIRITDDYYDNMYPVIDRDSSGRRWVFWTAYDNGRMELRYTTGENGSWQQSATLADEMKTNVSPSVVIDKQDTVWVVWSANNDGLDDIYVAFYENDAWSGPANLHDRNEVPDMLPEIGLDGAGHPAVDWQTLKDGKPVVVTSRLTDTGWSVPEVKEETETGEHGEETLELPSYVNNTSMVFVRVY